MPPKSVLITGAARGIGLACAQKFAASGYSVCIHFNTSAKEAEAAAAALAGPGKHCTVQANLSERGAPAKLIADAVAKLGGGLDVCVANHGIYEETPFETTSAEEFASSFERLLRINLAAPAELAHAAATHMKSRDGGSIVFVSSRGALRGEPLAPAYGASKSGLNSLTGSLAQAFGPSGIRVAAVAPGFINTAMAAPVLAGERGDGIRQQSPMNRVGEPEEVAAAVHFLASEEGQWSSGAVLDCNGASYLH